jgi:hypothetical protein
LPAALSPSGVRQPYHARERRRPRPADWGIGMTVCIAAIADEANAIIFTMDQMITVGSTAADLPDLAKGMRVHDRWFATFAGNVEQVPRIIGTATDLLSPIRMPTAEQVIDIFTNVYTAHRNRIAAQNILSPQGLTLERFTEMIATNDNSLLRSLSQRLNDFDFDLDFLVGGFDANPSPRVFHVRPPGVEGRDDDVGYWAAGIGAEAAVNNLMLRGHNRFQPLAESIYQVAESKFVAESSLGVGQRTAMAVLRHDESIALITRQRADSIREIWDNEGRAPMPQNLDTRIGPLLRFIRMPFRMAVREEGDESE